jgi:hypothetical protein
MADRFKVSIDENVLSIGVYSYGARNAVVHWLQEKAWKAALPLLPGTA